MSEIEDPAAQVRNRFTEVPPMRMRQEREDDLDFLCALYRTTREDELERVDWSETQKQQFVEHQFLAQRSQYRQHYANAGFLIIECDQERIGRFYLHRTRAELRLMEVTLVPERRNQGLGSRLMQRLLDWSKELGLPVTLHVEPFNPAQRLYQRLGFETIEVRGVYHFMRRDPADTDAGGFTSESGTDVSRRSTEVGNNASRTSQSQVDSTIDESMQQLLQE